MAAEARRLHVYTLASRSGIATDETFVVAAHNAEYERLRAAGPLPFLEKRASRYASSVFRITLREPQDGEWVTKRADLERLAATKANERKDAHHTKKRVLREAKVVGEKRATRKNKRRRGSPPSPHSRSQEHSSPEPSPDPLSLDGEDAAAEALRRHAAGHAVPADELAQARRILAAKAHIGTLHVPNRQAAAALVEAAAAAGIGVSDLLAAREREREAARGTRAAAAE